MKFNYQQNFEGLNIGDLNGQDEWSGNVNYQIQDSIAYTGIKAVQFSGSPKFISRNTDLFETGMLSFCFRCSNPSSVYAVFDLYYSGLDNPGISIIFYNKKIYFYDKYEDEMVYSGHQFFIDTWVKIKIEFDKDKGEGGQYKAKVNDGNWSNWLGAGGGPYSNFPGSNKITLSSYSNVICYLDDIETLLSPNRTNKKNYNGYLAFIQQYIKHKIAGTYPWANPDGTPIW